MKANIKFPSTRKTLYIQSKKYLVLDGQSDCVTKPYKYAIIAMHNQFLNPQTVVFLRRKQMSSCLFNIII